MTKSNLLLGIVSPLVVSKITAGKFRRVGMHPFYYRLHKKKYGGWAWKKKDMWDMVIQTPHVSIIGARDEVLYRHYVKSNQEAFDLRDELRLQLNSYLEKLKHPDEVKHTGYLN